MKKETPEVESVDLEDPWSVQPDSEGKRSGLFDREIRKQRIFNGFVGLLSLVLFLALLAAWSMDSLSASKPAPSHVVRQPRISTGLLPENEQWVIGYRQAAWVSDDRASTEQKELSMKWIKNAAYHLIMGKQAFLLDDPVVAQAHFEQAIKIFPSMTGVYPLLGSACLKQQCFGEALKAFQKALNEDRSVCVLNNLGVAYIGLKKYAAAEKILKEALQKSPDCAGCYKNLAWLYQETGRTREANTAAATYFALHPEDVPMLRSYTENLIGDGQLHAAIDFLDQIESNNPPIVHLLLAKITAYDNDIERAIRELQKAAQWLAPHQIMQTLQDPAFDPARRTESFEALLKQMNLALAAFPTNGTEIGAEP